MKYIMLPVTLQNCVYHTELGQAIGKTKDVVYVSKNNRKTWITLTDFVTKVGQYICVLLSPTLLSNGHIIYNYSKASIVINSIMLPD